MNTELSELEKQVLQSRKTKMLNEIKPLVTEIASIMAKYGLSDRDDLKHLRIYRMSSSMEGYCSLDGEFADKPKVKKRIILSWMKLMEKHAQEMEEIKNIY